MFNITYNINITGLDRMGANTSVAKSYSDRDKPRKQGGSKTTTFTNGKSTSEAQKTKPSGIILGDKLMHQQLADAIPHIAYSLYADGTPEHYNQRWYDYTGIEEAAAFSDWDQIIHPEDMEGLFSAFREAEQHGKEYTTEYRLKNRHGYYRWHMVKSAPIRDQDGNIVRWFGTITDIHDKKELEDNLTFLSESSKVLSSSLDYRKTLQHIAELAVPKIADWCTVDILDKDGKLEQVSLAHKDPEKVRWAKKLRELEPPDMSAETGLAKVIRSGEPEFYHFISDEMLQAIAKDKEQLALLRSIGFTSAMVVPLFNDGKSIGGITFVSAENKRRYNESDLAMACELASRASIALRNAELYETSQHAITLRDDFISVASHELKTPVTSAKIFTQVLQRHTQKIGDTKGVEYLQKMDRQLDKLTELIYTMLDISRIQVGRIEFSKRKFDFDQIVAESVESYNHDKENHSVTIKGKTNSYVWGDEDRVSQVISNLIENAIKYSPKAQEVVVHLSANNHEVICGVEDYGIGIDEHHLERIFERFYRVFDATDKTFPGLGVGLYICSEIMERHDGRLWVESQKGLGSTFYISLPIFRSEP